MIFVGVIDIRKNPNVGIHLRVTKQGEHVPDVVAIDIDRKVGLVRVRNAIGKFDLVPDADGVLHLPEPVEVDATGWTVLDRRDNSTITL